jgi:putative (di)nucleoside polyphosphate hydrolase
MGDTYFRAGVGVCVTDGNGRVLALRRKGLRRAGWQMPQGGIDTGETPLQAMWRELSEETGLTRTQVTLVRRHADWLAYELPPAMRRAKVGWGQVQKWFLLRTRRGAVVRPDDVEFSAFEWLTPKVLLSRVIAFRRPVYRRVLGEFLGK